MAVTKIQTVTLASATANIDFTSIPSSYTDLMLVASVREATSNDVVALVRFNGDASSAYTTRNLQGNGSSSNSGGNTSPVTYADQIGEPSNYTASTFGSMTLYIPNYAGANAKSFSGDSVSENNATASYQRIQTNLWNNTSAITRITLTTYSGANWAQYSSATLYGITKGSSGGVTVS